MKQVWIRADIDDSKESRKEKALSAIESGADAVIVRPEDSDFLSFSKDRFIFNNGGMLSGAASGKIILIDSPESQNEILALKEKIDCIVLETPDWAVIPLENIIAKFGKDTKIMASASGSEEAKLFLSVLEKGADGIVTDDLSLIQSIKESNNTVKFETGTITSIKDVGMGDRVCIDTCSMMVPGEGMLIGSQSSCMVLVQSESEEVGYVEPRPFRVNAGAVHSYIMMPDGTTRYLSELKSGDIAAIVDSKGNVKTSAIGRCKIERRPLILLEIDGKHTVILQNAETVKLIGPDGAKSVSQLTKSDKVYVRTETGGRHFGMKVDETVKEL